MTNKDEDNFYNQCENEITRQGASEPLQTLTQQWMDQSIETNYSYHFNWLGRPIIQYPQDIVAAQQLLWTIKPDLVIETGIARGGSIVFYASMLELIAQCGGPSDAKVLGVDIDIRSHNREAIIAHPMSKRIDMIEGSSIDPSIVEQVKQRAQNAQRVMICLDSNHTHEHVLEELRLYSPMVSINSYIVVFDTIVEDLEDSLVKDRPWSKGNNPKTAVFEFLKELKTQDLIGLEGKPLNLEIDERIENQLLITVAPSGYLKRI